MNKFKIKIGLENHLRINSQKKLFCNCNNLVNKDKINQNTCHICLGFPGSLPKLNENIIKKISFFLSMFENFQNDLFYFERKHYDYYDLPKGYQITQLDSPVAKNGIIYIFNQLGEKKKIRIERIAIEEDAGKSIKNKDKLLVDYSRSGSPLLEITTCPDFETIEGVINYLKIIRFLAISSNIIDSKNSSAIRCDVNISLIYNNINFPRTELKNLNNFTDIKNSLQFEIKRQKESIIKKIQLEAETREWNGKETILLRKKNDFTYCFSLENNLLARKGIKKKKNIFFLHPIFILLEKKKLINSKNIIQILEYIQIIKNNINTNSYFFDFIKLPIYNEENIKYNLIKEKIIKLEIEKITFNFEKKNNYFYIENIINEKNIELFFFILIKISEKIKNISYKLNNLLYFVIYIIIMNDIKLLPKDQIPIAIDEFINNNNDDYKITVKKFCKIIYKKTIYIDKIKEIINSKKNIYKTNKERIINIVKILKDKNIFINFQIIKDILNEK